MTTNLLQLLHTTTAYQTAAMQLMVGEANFAAKQLDLKEPMPFVVPAKVDPGDVESPVHGVAGSVSSPNYDFYFAEGRLRSVRRRDWFKKISPPANDVLELADRPSLLDTNTAYALARAHLAALSVDVAELEKKCPPVIFQLRGMKRGVDRRRTGEPVAIPLFMIGWGEDPMNAMLQERLRQTDRPLPQRPPSDRCPVFVEILGTTRELIELSINDPTFIKRPPLQLTNREELLGPTPPPRHFVEELVGGKDAYETMAAPDKVEAWLLTSSFGGEQPVEKKDRTPAVKLTPQAAKAFSDALLDFDTYLWNVRKKCIMDEGARLRFTRGGDTVDVRLCYECDMLTVTHRGQTNDGDFDGGNNALVDALLAVFPDDASVQGLKTTGKYRNENKNQH
jgi:hypothetical protein